MDQFSILNSQFSIFKPFVIPFTAGLIILLAVVLWKWARWFWLLDGRDKSLIRSGLFTRASFGAVGEVVSESLLHRRIWRRNARLGYMHTSLAFGWFLLIVVGWAETSFHIGLAPVPPYTHVFFKQFSTHLDHSSAVAQGFSHAMDLLLLFVLSGVVLAWFKRLSSRRLGMRRTTKHTPGDRVALAALWFIFPVRLIAESITSGVHEMGGFLTASIGRWLVDLLGVSALSAIEPLAWWAYSIVLGLFFVAMPFSRYMHIFTEIPLIFLRRYGLRSGSVPTGYDCFQVEACSRCGICIDPCQLQADAGVKGVQSVYFLRDVRQGKLGDRVAANCLMCGRCEVACPVGIETNALRLGARKTLSNPPVDGRYDYLSTSDLRPPASEKVGYFAGCMTLLTPRILRAMEQIFDAAGEPVWWADRQGGVCCGRPLRLSGEVDAAQAMIDHNAELFAAQGITTLVTSCPICLKVFREEYALPGVEVLHHSQYIARLIEQGRLEIASGSALYTYHDPCELGRGSGIYEAPRAVIGAVGTLVEMAESRENALCCGSSVANTAITDTQQAAIARAVGAQIEASGACGVVTACPLCKKALARGTDMPVYDLAEIVAGGLV